MSEGSDERAGPPGRGGGRGDRGSRSCWRQPRPTAPTGRRPPRRKPRPTAMPLDPEVAEHEREMGKIGAEVKGEGEID